MFRNSIIHQNFPDFLQPLFYGFWGFFWLGSQRFAPIDRHSATKSKKIKASWKKDSFVNGVNATRSKMTIVGWKKDSFVNAEQDDQGWLEERIFRREHTCQDGSRHHRLPAERAPGDLERDEDHRGSDVKRVSTSQCPSIGRPTAVYVERR